MDTKTATRLSETDIYRSILASLRYLDRTVRLDPDGFACNALVDIEVELSELADAVAEGVI
jgi:hypothetical protein